MFNRFIISHRFYLVELLILAPPIYHLYGIFKMRTIAQLSPNVTIIIIIFYSELDKTRGTHIYVQYRSATIAIIIM